MNNPLHFRRLGILGGGQLGRMLIQAAVPFNVTCHVLDDNKNAPCAPICTHFTQGKYQDFDTVVAFGKHCDVLTIEIEHVNADALQELENQGVAVFPQSHIVRLIQNKKTQKEFYKHHAFPTADFVSCDSKESLMKQLTEKGILRNNGPKHSETIPFPLIQKSCQGGYDGYGVKSLQSQSDAENALKGPCIIEEKIQIERELSVIVTRSITGDITVFPTIEQFFHPNANILSHLMAPAPISDPLNQAVQRIAKEVAETLKIVGNLAIEFFVSADQKVYINEMAPRPHNSGHHTIQANMVSQFEQHLRAILGYPLLDTTPRSAAAMGNILGKETAVGDANPIFPKAKINSPFFIHWYGKTQTKPFRKLGHITVLSDTPENALEDLKKIEIE